MLKRHSHKGFSLIELMIVVAIIGIISAVAYPSYQQSIQRGDRAAAKATMLEAQQFMERYYAANGRYTTDAAGTTSPTLPTRLQRSPESGTAKHTIAVGSPSLNSYTITATPANASDPCGNLTITNTGARGRSGSGLSVNECWR